jgi:hypothetical protein
MRFATRLFCVLVGVMALLPFVSWLKQVTDDAGIGMLDVFYPNVSIGVSTSAMLTILTGLFGLFVAGHAVLGQQIELDDFANLFSLTIMVPVGNSLYTGLADGMWVNPATICPIHVVLLFLGFALYDNTCFPGSVEIKGSSQCEEPSLFSTNFYKQLRVVW